MSGWFDADRWPRIIIHAGWAPTVTGACEIGAGLRDTAKIGGVGMITIPQADIRSVTWTRGRDSDIDPVDPGQCTIVLDNHHGHYDPDNTAGPHTIRLGSELRVLVERPAGRYWPRFTGTLNSVDVDAGIDPTVTITCGDALQTLGAVTLATEPAASFDGQRTSERVGTICDRAGWPATARLFDTGQVQLGPTVLGGTALELAQTVAQTEFGLVYADANGNIVFTSRYRPLSAPRSATVQAVISDTGTAGHLTQTDLTTSVSVDRTFNRVVLTRDTNPADPGDTPVEQVAEDLASIGAIGRSSFPGSVGQLLRTDTEVAWLAEWLLVRFSTPRQRVKQVTVNALTAGVGDVWPTLLTVDLLDRVRVDRTYGVPATVTVSHELLVQQVTETIDAQTPSWELRLSTSEPVPTFSLCTLGAGLIETDQRG